MSDAAVVAVEGLEVGVASVPSGVHVALGSGMGEEVVGPCGVYADWRTHHICEGKRPSRVVPFTQVRQNKIIQNIKYVNYRLNPVKRGLIYIITIRGMSGRKKCELPSWLMTSDKDLASSKPGKFVAISNGLCVLLQ